MVGTGTIEIGKEPEEINTDLVVNGWTNVNQDFTHVGSIYYLHDDDDTNYIYHAADAVGDGDYDEYYHFTDLDSKYNEVALWKLELRVKAKLVAGVGGPCTQYNLGCHVWDGTSWVNVGIMSFISTSYETKTLNVIGDLDTLEKIQNARLKLEQNSVIGGGADKGTCRITYAYLHVEAIGFGTFSDFTAQNYISMGFRQDHPKDTSDKWEATLDVAHDAVAYGDSVYIKRDGVVIFSGFVDTIEPSFTNKGSLLYVSGPDWRGSLANRRNDQKMQGTLGTADIDKSFFNDCYPDEVMKFITQLPENDAPDSATSRREGWGVDASGWSMWVPSTLTLNAGGYTPATYSDIGKQVQDDTVEVGVLLGFDNSLRLWLIDTTSVIAGGSSMTITAGTGAGTATGNSVYAGNTGNKGRMNDRDNSTTWKSSSDQAINQAILINLNALLDITGIIIDMREAGTYDSREFMKHYEIRVSDDATSWTTVASKEGNTAKEIVHALDPLGNGADVQFILIILKYGCVDEWAVTEIFVYKATTTPLAHRLPIVQGTMDSFEDVIPAFSIDSYMSLDKVFNKITNLTLTPKEGAVPTSVTLRLRIRDTADGGAETVVSVYLWDGAAWQLQYTIGSDYLSTSFILWAGDVKTTLSTVDKINNTMLGFQITTAGDPDIRISHARLEVTVGGQDYTLTVIGRMFWGHDQVWAYGGDEPWLDVDDDNTSYIEEKTLNDKSEGYIFQKLGGDRPWEFWVDGVRIRQLLFAAGGYTDCVLSDIGKPVVGGTTGDSGTLVYYNNIRKHWWVLMDANGDLFDQAESITITGGTGAGTTLRASIAGKVWNFQRRRGSDKSGSVEIKYDSAHTASYIFRIERRGSTKEPFVNRIKVIGYGDSDEDAEYATSDWKEDATSIATHGLHEDVFSEEGVETKESANTYALVILSEFKNVIYAVSAKVYDSYASNTWGVGDEITLTDTHTGTSGKHRVMHIERDYDGEGENVTIIVSKSTDFLPKYRQDQIIEHLVNHPVTIFDLIKRAFRHGLPYVRV